MNQLELLWDLQIHDQKLNDIKANLNELEKGAVIDNINLNIKRLERDIKTKKNDLEKDDERIRKSNSTLQQLNYELIQVEKDLYSGVVTDLQQLDYMDKESKSLRKETNHMELEILSLMEEIEDLKKILEDIEYEHEKMKDEFKKYNIQYKTMEADLKKEAKIEIGTMNEIMSKLEKAVLEKYNMIKRNKDDAVVEIFKNECSGCHMIIPTYLINKVKNEQDIFQCENCGRILYYNRLNESKNEG